MDFVAISRDALSKISSMVRANEESSAEPEIMDENTEKMKFLRLAQEAIVEKQNNREITEAEAKAFRKERRDQMRAPDDEDTNEGTTYASTKQQLVDCRRSRPSSRLATQKMLGNYFLSRETIFCRQQCAGGEGGAAVLT